MTWNQINHQFTGILIKLGIKHPQSFKNTTQHGKVNMVNIHLMIKFENFSMDTHS